MALKSGRTYEDEERVNIVCEVPDRVFVMFEHVLLGRVPTLQSRRRLVAPKVRYLNRKTAGTMLTAAAPTRLRGAPTRGMVHRERECGRIYHRFGRRWGRDGRTLCFREVPWDQLGIQQPYMRRTLPGGDLAASCFVSRVWRETRTRNRHFAHIFITCLSLL